MESKTIANSFKQDIINALNELENYGFDRRKVEKEIRYSEFSIDQQLSRGGNEKLLVVISLLLKSIKLQKAIDEMKKPAQSRSDKEFKEVLDKLGVLNDNVKAVHQNVVDSHQAILVTQSISQSVLREAALIEVGQPGDDHSKRVAELFAESLAIYDNLYLKSPVAARNKVA